MTVTWSLPLLKTILSHLIECKQAIFADDASLMWHSCSKKLNRVDVYWAAVAGSCFLSKSPEPEPKCAEPEAESSEGKKTEIPSEVVVQHNSTTTVFMLFLFAVTRWWMCNRTAAIS